MDLQNEQKSTSEKSSKDLNTAPDEIILHILSFLNLSDRSTFGNVSRRMNGLASDNLYWKKQVQIHFPHAIKNLETHDDVNYYALYRQYYKKDYENLSMEHRILFELVKTKEIATCFIDSEQEYVYIGYKIPDVNKPLSMKKEDEKRRNLLFYGSSSNLPFYGFSSKKSYEDYRNDIREIYIADLNITDGSGVSLLEWIMIKDLRELLSRIIENIVKPIFFDKTASRYDFKKKGAHDSVHYSLQINNQTL